MTQEKQKICFVIMPFSEERLEVYKYAVAPACEAAGFRAVRVDELKGHFNINKKIIQHLFRADAVVAELSDMNPNVFYEMGVAHAIGNKTIMCAQSANDLPFDIRNYRCIIYKQSIDGLKALEKEIAESLHDFPNWSRDASNPVQDFKPRLRGETVPAEELAKLQAELRQKNADLAKAVLRAEHEALKKRWQSETARAEKAVREVEALNDKLLRREKQLTELEARLRQNETRRNAPAKASVSKSPPVSLRSKPAESLSEKAVKEMLQEKGFYDKRKNASGEGVQNQFEQIDKNGAVSILDHATGLTWQQSGSKDYMKFKSAQDYIDSLNAEKFGGFNDWRLPTLEEGMSLMAPKKGKNGLFIDEVFDATQRWIWTADKKTASSAWVASFYFGSCDNYRFDFDFSISVRAVR